MKIISKFIFFIIYDFLNDKNGGNYYDVQLPDKKKLKKTTT